MFAPRITAAATSVMLGFSIVPLPQAAYAATSTYLVPARGVADATVGPPIEVAYQSFPAGARLVMATVSGRLAARSTRLPTMLSVDLICGDETVQATTNVVTTVTLSPRRIVQSPTSCHVIATSGRSLATSGDGVQVSVRLTSTVVRWGAVGYQPDGWPELVSRGWWFDAVPVTVAVPEQISRLQITGDMKVTTCTSVGGSRENGSPYLCENSRLNRTGSNVSVQILVEQLGLEGGVCAKRVVSTRTAQITRQAHHGVVSQQSSYVLSRAPGCSRNIRVKQHAKVLTGADIVVHRQGTITNIYG